MEFLLCDASTHRQHKVRKTMETHTHTHNLWLKIILLFAIEQDTSTICVALQQHQPFYEDVWMFMLFLS